MCKINCLKNSQDAGDILPKPGSELTPTREAMQTYDTHESGFGIGSSSSNINNNIPKPTVLQVCLWSLLTWISTQFSLFLPIFQSKAGAKTFVHAGYNYDDDLTTFDNTAWTWGTDYAMAFIFAFAAIQCWRARASADRGPNSNTSTNANSNTTTNTSVVSTESLLPESSSGISASRRLRTRSMLLLLSYAISVLFGGYAHYTFRSVEELNTISFRICWIICVGSVTAAGGFMGSCGSEICLVLNHARSRMADDVHAHGHVRFRMPYIPDLLWIIYGGFLTYVCISGGMSYQRPACDIFVAGTSQFVPTVYCIMTVLSVKWPDADDKPGLDAQVPQPQPQPTDFASDIVQAIKKGFRYMFYLGLSLNAPLLPAYPALVQYTNLSTGIINALLHSNLTVAWGMQAMSLHHFCKAFNLHNNNNPVHVSTSTKNAYFKSKEH